MTEPKIKDVLLALESDNVLSAITQDRGTIESFDYYKRNPASLVGQIVQSEKEIRTQYIKGLVEIYPLSADILGKVMEHFDLKDMKDDVYEWFDVSETVIKMTGKFFNLCSQDMKEKGTASEFEGMMKDLENQMECLKIKREEYKEHKFKLAEKRQEVDELKRECEEMKQKYSPELLAVEEEKYRLEKKKLEEDKRNYEAKLKDFEKELEPYKKMGNKEFDKALEAFSKVIESLPNDEG